MYLAYPAPDDQPEYLTRQSCTTRSQFPGQAQLQNQDSRKSHESQKSPGKSDEYVLFCSLHQTEPYPLMLPRGERRRNKKIGLPTNCRQPKLISDHHWRTKPRICSKETFVPTRVTR